MKNALLKYSLLCWGTLLLGACGGQDQAREAQPASAGCDASKQGFISCGTNGFVASCQPGQYCSDETFGYCSQGCLADINCACNQVCVIPAQDTVGTCRNQMSAVCGNGTCEAGESAASCPGDCAAPAAVCGNGVCQAGESTASCPGDCPPASACGNGACDAAETSATCPVDCPDYLAAARDICSSYDFFSCFGPGELQACFDACDRASAAQLQQFWNCGGTGSVACDPCTQYLP